jgi:hypothetical protein
MMPASICFLLIAFWSFNLSAEDLGKHPSEAQSPAQFNLKD